MIILFLSFIALFVLTCFVSIYYADMTSDNYLFEPIKYLSYSLSLAIIFIPLRMAYLFTYKRNLEKNNYIRTDKGNK
jgi:Cu/Ag efflux pump CusA